MDNSVLSQSDAEPHRAERVVYRHGQKGWLNLVWSVPFCLFCFWLATSQFFLDKSAPTAEEIAKGQVTDNSILLWVNFGFGALLLLFAFSLVWSQLFFRLVADRDGVCWRPFIEWKSALWSEVTECHLSITNTPEIRAKEELITLQSSAPGWPATRDYIAARVQLPDGIEAWQPKPVADSEEKRARLSKDDDGTPIKTSTKIGWFALMGVVIMGGFTLALLNEGKGVGGGDIFLLAIVGALFVALPLLLQVRDFVICDDLSLTIGTLKQRRTVAFADIEDLFLLRHRNQHSVTWKPCIVVAGETIPLENLGKKRDAMLNRIEARALNSRSPQFARRDFAPLADKLALPARFNYRDALAKIKWRCAQLTLLALLCPALVAVAIYNVGWENLEDSRGILAFSGVALALVLSWAGKRALAKLCRARARFNLDEELRADESGFWFESRAATTNIAWPDIARLESDTPNGWDATCRVYDVRGDFIEFDEQIARADLLGLLLLERSGLKWQSSLQTLALLHGASRATNAA